MNPFYPIVAERAERVCEYCRAPEAVFNFSFDVDHVIPTSKGGTNSPENLALSCRSCNAYKSAFEVGSTISGDSRALFNPRLDVWSEHFVLNLDTLEIEGVTDVGIASINRLRLNSPSQLAARLVWRNKELLF